MNINNVAVIFIFILIIVLTVFSTLYFIKNNVVTNNNSTLTDTVYIKGDTIVEKHYFTKEIITNDKAQEVTAKFANTKLDSTIILNDDSLKFKADITYSFIDSTFYNKFNFDISHSEYKRIDTLKETKIIEIKEDQHFYETGYFNFILGLISAIIIFFISN